MEKKFELLMTECSALQERIRRHWTRGDEELIEAAIDIRAALDTFAELLRRDTFFSVMPCLEDDFAGFWAVCLHVGKPESWAGTTGIIGKLSQIDIFLALAFDQTCAASLLCQASEGPLSREKSCAHRAAANSVIAARKAFLVIERLAQARTTG